MHIAFQFKKQCEKSDARFREYLTKNITNEESKTSVQDETKPTLETKDQISQQLQQQQDPMHKQEQTIQQELQHQIQPQQIQIQQQQPQAQQPAQQIDVNQLTHIPQNNCVYIECTPLLDISQEQRFDTLAPVTQQQQQQQQSQPLTQVNYNVPSQNQLHSLGSYSLHTVGQVQVYNGNYTMPLQPMQPSLMHNQVITPQMSMQHQVQLPTHSNLIQQQRQQETQQTPQTQQQQQQHLQQQFQQQLQQPQQQQQDNVSNQTEKKKSIKTNKKDAKDDNNKQCSTCKKIFATSTKLTRHMRTHSTYLPYKCKVCSRGFSHSGNYKIHLRMHTDERPFRCPVCDKGCRQAQDLEKHMRTHTGNNNYFSPRRHFSSIKSCCLF